MGAYPERNPQRGSASFLALELVKMPLTAHQAAALVAAAARTGDPKREVAARRDLAEAKIADAIARAVASAPPLTPSQTKRLSALLRTASK